MAQDNDPTFDEMFAAAKAGEASLELVENDEIAALSAVVVDLAEIIHRPAPDQMDQLVERRRDRLSALAAGRVQPRLEGEPLLARWGLEILLAAMSRTPPPPTSSRH